MMPSTVLVRVVVYIVFFFKQKTAYEMRISDWSSDVCSSDLEALGLEVELLHVARQAAEPGCRTRLDPKHQFTFLVLQHAAAHQIGRASCRERVCQYV